MLAERSESDGRATTTWHECPLCHQVRMTSEPVNPRADSLTADSANDTLLDDDDSLSPHDSFIDNHPYAIA
ncbi:MAG: hypothetical protein CSB44_12750 [Gammaproteobacteria bacterium]|nr:MAG: hypothetical protein CSB44_12750 [Gammaproteobacteria bacterium]